MLILFLSLCLTFSHTLGQSQNLTAVYSNSVFPFGICGHVAWYDGDDSIYILGAMLDETIKMDTIFKYSIASDNIKLVGSLPEPFGNGRVEGDHLGNIYALGGYSGPDNSYKVHRFDPARNISSSIVGPYPKSSYNNGPVLKRNSTSNTLLIIGGRYDDLTMKEFHMDTLSFSDIPNVPLPYYFYDAVAVRFNDTKSYIFTGAWEEFGKVWELDLESLEFRELGENSHFQGSVDDNRVGFSDGEFVYMVGGFHNIRGLLPDWVSQEGVLKFDPESEVTTFLHIDNWPVKDGVEAFRSAPQCVYVDKLGRMYCFGGFAIADSKFENKIGQNPNYLRLLDSIFYVDLNLIPSTSEAPDTSTTSSNFCLGIPNGLYPHQTDCTSFISCWDGESYQLFCPEGTFYSPNLQNCGTVNYCDFTV